MNQSTQQQTRNVNPEALAKGSAMIADAQARAKMSATVAWVMANADVMQWIDANAGNDFADSLAVSLNKFGSLTEPQSEAVRRNITRAKVDGPAPAITVERIEQAFAAAIENGVKRPRMNLDTFTFKPAGQKSANVGGIYVTEDGEYLGKVMGGKFLKVSACDVGQQQRIISAASDPAAAASAYGQRTGACSICKRTLTAAESMDRHIGPICAGKYGFN